MRVLGAIVQALMLPMLHARHDYPLCCSMAGHLICDHDAQRRTLLLEQFAQQALSRFGITPTLDQDVEHDPMLVHGAPEPVLPARNADHDLIKVPLVPGHGQTPPDLIGITLPELQRPLAYRLMADLDSASISSSMRRLSGNRKYNQTAWLITSAGKRWRRSEDDVVVSSLTNSSTRVTVRLS